MPSHFGFLPNVAGIPLRLAVVIPNWNGSGILRDCLSNLAPLRSHAKVIVVDNGSIDDSREVLRNQFPWVATILNSENQGYARASNQGWRSTVEDLVMFLNNDTIPSADSILKIADYLDGHPKIGVAGPFLRLPSGESQPGGAAGWDLTLLSSIQNQLFLHLLLPSLAKPFLLHQPAFAGMAPMQVDWVSGAAMMVKREVLEKTGGMPDQYFMYAEDLDFCNRARKAGYGVCYLPNVEITHLHGASGQLAVVNTKWIESTIVYYRHSHGAIATAALAFGYALGACLRWCISIPLWFTDPKKARQKCRQYTAYMLASLRAIVG